VAANLRFFVYPRFLFGPQRIQVTPISFRLHSFWSHLSCRPLSFFRPSNFSLAYVCDLGSRFIEEPKWMGVSFLGSKLLPLPPPLSFEFFWMCLCLHHHVLFLLQAALRLEPLLRSDLRLAAIAPRFLLSRSPSLEIHFGSLLTSVSVSPACSHGHPDLFVRLKITELQQILAPRLRFRSDTV